MRKSLRESACAALVVLLAGCTSDLTGGQPPTGEPTSVHAESSAVPSDPPVPDNAFEGALCRRYSESFFDDARRDGFVRSRALVPAPLTRTGFGAPDAHCAADPDLGLYYEVLIWDRAVPAATIAAFVARLRAGGFTRDGGTETDPAFDAPPGIAAEIDERPSDLRRVYVNPPTAQDRTTSVYWI